MKKRTPEQEDAHQFLKQNKKTPARKSFDKSIEDYQTFFKSAWKAIIVAAPLLVTLTFMVAGILIALTGKFNIEIPKTIYNVAQIIAGTGAFALGASATHKVIRWSARENSDDR